MRVELNVDPAVAEWLAVLLHGEAAELARTAGKSDRFTAGQVEAVAEALALAVAREKVSS